MRYISFAGLGLLASLIATQPAQAYVFGGSSSNTDTVIVTDQGTMLLTESGWYRANGGDSGLHDSFNDNYIAGLNENPGSVYHNFLVFGLETLNGPISSATLNIYSYGVDTSFDAAATVIYSLFDVTTDIADLVTSNSGRGDIWTDLASGTLYGARSYTDADGYTVTSIPLNAAAVAAINAAGMQQAPGFAMGGTLAQAATATPEPASLAVLGAGLLGLAGLRRRRMHQPV
jgi:hypothetical protein